MELNGKEVKQVPLRLREAATLFETRAAAYGLNYLRFGRIMKALIPQLDITEEDWCRIGLYVQMVTKMTRYGNLFNRPAADEKAKMGRTDSLDDLSVYAQMLNETDDVIASGIAPHLVSDYERAP